MNGSSINSMHSHTHTYDERQKMAKAFNRNATYQRYKRLISLSYGLCPPYPRSAWPSSVQAAKSNSLYAATRRKRKMKWTEGYTTMGALPFPHGTAARWNGETVMKLAEPSRAGQEKGTANKKPVAEHTHTHTHIQKTKAKYCLTKYHKYIFCVPYFDKVIRMPED